MAGAAAMRGAWSASPSSGWTAVGGLPSRTPAPSVASMRSAPPRGPVKHGNSRVLALPPEMREALEIGPSDSLAIYQLHGALVIIPLRDLTGRGLPEILERLAG